MVDNQSIQKILVTRTDKLGDVILTLPLISELKRNFPESKITFLVSNFVKDLIEIFKGVDEIIFIEEFQSFKSKIRYFKNQKFDVAINVFPRFVLAFSFLISGIKIRIGSGYRWYSFLYNKRINEHRKYAEKHESDYNLNLLKPLIQNINYEKKYYFKYSQEEFLNLQKKLQGFDFQKKFIIIHPSSKGSAVDLPLDKITNLCSEILKYFKDFNVVLTGTKDDINTTGEIINSVISEERNRIFNLAGLLNLKELMILIDNSSLFISNSTGPVHIAGALNKNIIGFYPSKIPMNPERWKPLSENTVIISPKGTNDMNSISIKEILDAIETFLKINSL